MERFDSEVCVIVISIAVRESSFDGCWGLVGQQ